MASLEEKYKIAEKRLNALEDELVDKYKPKVEELVADGKFDEARSCLRTFPDSSSKVVLLYYIKSESEK